MVLQWLIQNSEKYAFRKRDEAEKARVSTAAALLTSLIADADVVTDWLYFAEIVNDDGEDENPVPSWIRVVQLVSCICGTLSWLAISSDGRLMDWLRQVTWWILWGYLVIIAMVFFWIPGLFIQFISYGCIDIKYDECCPSNIYDMLVRAKDNLNAFFDEGFRISSGGLLVVGILTEDLPQIAVTFLIEDAMGSWNDEKGISRSAYLNLVVAIFDILHKLASAWDDRKLYIPTGTGARTFLGHTGIVCSLAATGLDRIVSASYDGTARLWDIATNNTLQTFNIGKRGWGGSIVTLDNDQILTTSWESDGKMKVFNIESGECLTTIDSGDNAKCTVVSNNSDYFLTSKWTSNEIIRWDANSFEQMQKYPRKANSLITMDDRRFVSAYYTDEEEGHPVLWDVDSGDIIRTFNIQKSNSKVTTMSKCNGDSFLVASVHGGNTFIDMFTIGQMDSVKTMTMEGYKVDLLTSIGGDRFVTSEYDCIADSTVDLWDISTQSCLHTFEGHADYIKDIFYLPQQGAIATASDDRNLKVWPIPANLLIDDNADVEGG